MASAPPPIHLDGTTLEGGGQLLRVALSLSSLTRKPIHITKIRGRRSGGGGLKAQHLTSVQWLGQATHAQMNGAELKSKEIIFIPGTSPKAIGLPVHEDMWIQQTTPGSINLVFQAILPYILFSNTKSPIRLRIDGGTNVSNSPSTDYMTQVLLPMLSLIGIPHINIQIHARGWSQGSTSIGSVTYTISPLQSRLPGFHLTNRGDIVSVTATIIAPTETERQFREELDVMFERQKHRFFSHGVDDGGEVDTNVTFENSRHDRRYYLLLVATTSTGMKLGRDWLYDGGFKAGHVERVVPAIVKKVSEELLGEIGYGGCVDEYLRDQLVVFQALAQGESRVYGGERKGKGGRVKPSLHAKTAMWVVREILGVRFDNEGGCEGVGYLSNGVSSDDAVGEDAVRDLDKLDISA